MIEQCDLYPTFVDAYLEGAERLEYTIEPSRENLELFYQTIGKVCRNCSLRILCRPDPTSIGINTQFNFSDI